MTPILRKSKEAARKQRAKPPSERKASSSGGRIPISGARDRFPGPGGGRGGFIRKRRYDQGDYHLPHYAKHGRYSDPPQMPPYHGGHHYSPRGAYGRSISSGGSGGGVRSYEEYLRTIRQSSNDHQSSYGSEPPQYYTRGYHDKGYSRSSYSGDYGPRGEPGYAANYDRQVDEFLKHTSTASGGGGREYDRRYSRERR